MSLGDWLKKKLNIGSAPEESSEAQKQDDTISSEEDKSAIVETPDTKLDDTMEKQEDEVSEEELQAPANSLELLGQQLGTLKKGYFRSTNSAKYEAVRSAISDIVSSMGAGFSGDKTANQKMATDMLMKYGVLVSACEAYIAKSGGHFSSGQARKETVAAVLALAQKDMIGVRSAIDHLPSMNADELSTYSWKDVLADARTRKIIINKGIGKVQTLGGAASTVRRIKEADLSDKSAGGTGFFKAEEGVIFHEGDNANDEQYSRTKDAALQSIPLSEGELSRIAGCKRPSEILTDRKYFDSKNILDFADVWKKMSTAYNESFHQLFYDSLSNVVAHTGEEVSLTKRNVASSRVAEFLGAGDVIAHSELAEVKDASGKTVTGMLMQQAQGREGMEIKKELVYARQKEGFELGIPSNDVEFGKIPAGRSTGSLQKSMSTLQVMDFITGQEDRHAGNYFVQQNAEGKFTGVTGIDNDFAFGAGTKSQNHARKVIQDGRLYIPHMDKQLAERVLQLTRDQIVLLLGDLLKPNDIDPCWTRIQMLQDAIKADMADPQSKVLVEKDEDWGEQTHKDFMAKAYAIKNPSGMGTGYKCEDSSYYGDFMADHMISARFMGPLGTLHQMAWINNDAKKQYEDYINVRDITNPYMLRYYLTEEIRMNKDEVDRYLTQQRLDPMTHTFEELPTAVQSAFESFFGSSKKYNAVLAANKKKQEEKTSGTTGPATA